MPHITGVANTFLKESIRKTLKTGNFCQFFPIFLHFLLIFTHFLPFFFIFLHFSSFFFKKVQ